MILRSRAFALATAGVLVLGCGDAPTGEPPRTASPTTPPAAAPSPAPEPPSEQAEGSLRGDAVRGATLYASTCASCHGATGKGDGPIGQSLQPRPADHTDPDAMGKRSDEFLYRVIDKGGAREGLNPLMAAWGGVISDQDIRDLVAYIRQLSGT